MSTNLVLKLLVLLNHQSHPAHQSHLTVDDTECFPIYLFIGRSLLMFSRYPLLTPFTCSDRMKFTGSFILLVWTTSWTPALCAVFYWYGQLVGHQPYMRFIYWYGHLDDLVGYQPHIDALYLCVCVCVCMYLRVQGHDPITSSYVISRHNIKSSYVITYHVTIL